MPPRTAKAVATQADNAGFRITKWYFIIGAIIVVLIAYKPVVGLVDYSLQHHWADIFGIIGFPVALWGLWLTIQDARKARLAAEQAGEEVKKMKMLLQKVEGIAGLSDALTMMEEIKRLHRVNAWDNVLLDRYSTVRRTLIAIRFSNQNLTETEKNSMQLAIQQFKQIEEKVEMSLVNANSRPSTAHLNSNISRQMERVEEVLTTMKLRLGE